MPTEPDDGGRLANLLVDARRMEERFASVVIDVDDGDVDRDRRGVDREGERAGGRPTVRPVGSGFLSAPAGRQLC